MKEINEAELIARLILSTKRKKRDFSILDIAKDILALRDKLGGLGAVAKVIGISTGMLNQFLNVLKLPKPIQELVHRKKIDSVAIVHLLSKFPEKDIELLVPKIIEGDLSSQDLKILLPYRKQYKNENILDLLLRLHASKNIQVSVIRFPKTIIEKPLDQISEIIKTIVGGDNFVSVVDEGVNVDIKVKKAGEKILRLKAKEKKITLTELIATLIK